MGLYAGELGDLEGEEKYLLEASTAGAWTGPLFNLALAYRRMGRKTEAVETIERALKRDTDALASFSNFGAKSVHVAAPGVNRAAARRITAARSRSSSAGCRSASRARFTSIPLGYGSV